MTMKRISIPLESPVTLQRSFVAWPAVYDGGEINRDLKGFTFIEVMVVIIIISILATIAVPLFLGLIEGSEFKQVKTIVELTISAAKYYDMKQGIVNLDPANHTQQEIWAALNVSLPQKPKCDYVIAAAGTTGVQLQVKRLDTEEAILYTYNLPYGPGDVKEVPEKKYLTNLP